MNVLFTPHIEHYTIGLSKECTKQSHFNTPSKHILIPNIPKVRGLLKKFSLKLLPKIFDVVHTNTSHEGLIVCDLDKLTVDLADKIVPVCNDTDLYKKLSVKSLERSKKLHGRKQQKTT